MDASERPDVWSRMSWYFSILLPWFEWANSADGICNKYVTYEDGVTADAYHRYGMAYQGFVDENDKPCGFGTYRQEWDRTESLYKSQGSASFWNGKGYGLLLTFSASPLNGGSFVTTFLDDTGTIAGPESYGNVQNCDNYDITVYDDSCEWKN